MRLLAACALAAIALVLPAGVASPSLALEGTVASGTVLPVTLAAGGNCNGQCTTSINAAGTAATVGTLNILPNPSNNRQVVQVIHGALPWSVQVRATAATLGPADSVVLTLAGATSATLTLTSATALPATSGAVALGGGAGAGDVVLSARGACAATCSLALEIRLSNGAAVYAYPVQLVVT